MKKETKKAGKPGSGGFGAWCKERWRKFLVAVKRRPQMIPLVAFVVAFLFYALNMMHVSDTTARIQGPGMGLAGFVTMLFSMLSFLCCMNAFPYRKKTNMPMLILMFVLIGLVIFADVYYMNAIWAAIDPNAASPVVITPDTAYIALSYNNLRIHIILLAAAIVLTLLLPVYSKLLRKIKTSVEVSDNGNMEAIDISGEA